MCYNNLSLNNLGWDIPGIDQQFYTEQILYTNTILNEIN